MGEIDTPVKENVTFKKLQTQSINEIWDTMKRPRIRILSLEEEEFHLNGPENVFNKIIKEFS